MIVETQKAGKKCAIENLQNSIIKIAAYWSTFGDTLIKSFE